jgi:hypothetical protein
MLKALPVPAASKDYTGLDGQTERPDAECR